MCHARNWPLRSLYRSQAWYNISSPSCLKLRISSSRLAVLDGGQYLWIKAFLRRSQESTVPGGSLSTHILAAQVKVIGNTCSMIASCDTPGEPLGAEVDEPLVDPVIDELAEPIVEVEEQMVAQVMGIEVDLVMLFGVEEDSSGDDFEGPKGDKEVWEMDEEWLMAPVTLPFDASYAPTKHLRVIEDLCTRMRNLEYGHGQLVKNVIMVSDAEVADSIDIGEIGHIVSTMEGQMQVMASQMVQMMSRLEQVRAHVKRDVDALE
uniref:Uncharacterized protein n=1 Tax=Tanacetum cinerariifolium TaxID=118510 RepID=A0A6L2L4G4_TANCI|nr:hypothetical protein [Tanacetum cinerariifolium]